MLCSGYDHDSNRRTKIIKLIQRSFKYPKLELDLVDYNNSN
jgi:hypothetical protein